MKNNMKYRLWLPVAFAVWLFDFISKLWAEKTFSQLFQLNVLGEWLRFRLVYNTGGVFGIMPGNPFVFHVITGVALLLLFIYFLRSKEGELFNASMALVLGGALGNFTDRFFRHGVVDFIDMGIGIHRWPTYNVADIFILFGAVLMAIYFFKNPASMQLKE